MPLVTRVGEKFQGGCVVDVLQPGWVKMTVSQAGAEGSLTITSSASQTVAVVPGRPLVIVRTINVT